MEFTYNESLVLENNEALEGLLCQIEREELLELVREVVALHMTEAVVEEELLLPLEKFGRGAGITEDNLRCFFAITLGGTGLVWEAILCEYSYLFNSINLPLHENVLEFIDELLDETDFSDHICLASAA